MNFLKHPTEMADRTENIVKGDEGVRGGGRLGHGINTSDFFRRNR